MIMLHINMSDHPRVQHAIQAADTFIITTTCKALDRMDPVESRMHCAVEGIMSTRVGLMLNKYPRVKNVFEAAPEVPRFAIGLAVMGAHWALDSLTEAPIKKISSRRDTHDMFSGIVD